MFNAVPVLFTRFLSSRRVAAWLIGGDNSGSLSALEVLVSLVWVCSGYFEFAVAGVWISITSLESTEIDRRGEVIIAGVRTSIKSLESTEIDRRCGVDRSVAAANGKAASVSPCVGVSWVESGLSGKFRKAEANSVFKSNSAGRSGEWCTADSGGGEIAAVDSGEVQFDLGE